MFYLDYSSLGGAVDDVLHHLSIVEELFRQLGLRLTRAKSEVICQDPGTLDNFFLRLLGFKESNFVRFPFSNNVVESILDKVSLLLGILEARAPFIQPMMPSYFYTIFSFYP